MYRTVLRGEDEWDGLSAITIDDENGKWAEYIWEPLDNLLYISFYTAEHEWQCEEVVSERSNPIPTLWKNSPHREMELLPTDYFLDLA